MVGDVLPGAERRVPLPEPPRRDAQSIDDAHPPPIGPVPPIFCSTTAREVVDRALVDDEAAIHERFAELELGIEHHGPFGRLAREAHADRLAAAVAETVQAALASMISSDPLARTLLQIAGEQPIHGGDPLPW